MKKVLMMAMVLLIVLITVGSASAWHRHPRGHRHQFGVFIGPPVIYVPLPPPVRYHYYYPPYDYYDRGYRVWVPGYWDTRWTSYGWERVWIPSHWEWRVDP